MTTHHVPGSVVAGRYRLRSRVPTVAWASFWMARDLRTAATVTVTLVHVDVILSRDPETGAVRRFTDLARTDESVLDVVAVSSHDAVSSHVVVSSHVADSRFVVIVARPERGGVPTPPWPVGPAPDAPPSTTVPSASLLSTPERRVVSVLVACAVVVLFGAGGWFVATSVFGGEYGAVEDVVAAPALPGAENASDTQTVPDTSNVPDTENVLESVATGGPVLPTDVQAWSAVRYPDNAEEARLAVDADPNTAWSTDRYRDRFGSADNGIGVVVSFADAADIAEVWVASPHPGSVVEIRTPPDPNGTLDDTRVLGSGVLGAGATHIPLAAASDAQALLVWVAELAPSGTQFVADFSEIGFTRE